MTTGRRGRFDVARADGCGGVGQHEARRRLFFQFGIDFRGDWLRQWQVRVEEGGGKDSGLTVFEHDEDCIRQCVDRENSGLRQAVHISIVHGGAKPFCCKADISKCEGNNFFDAREKSQGLTNNEASRSQAGRLYSRRIGRLPKERWEARRVGSQPGRRADMSEHFRYVVYSFLKACAGSTEAARCAGRIPATHAATASVQTAAAMTLASQPTT